MNPITLDGFCHHLVGGRGPGGRLYPASLAGEFVDFFGLSAFPCMEEIEALLEDNAVATVVYAHGLRGLRGYHTGARGGTYEITLDADESRSAQEHTALHEAYEIIRERLHDLHPYVGRPRGRAFCRQADRFAASALMQPRWFSLFAEASGYDVVALQETYGRAYSSLALRLTEVVPQPLLAVLYERRTEGGLGDWVGDAAPERFEATVVSRAPGFRLRTQRRPLSSLRGLLPRCGEPPAQGSVAERVMRTGRPVYVERVSGYDLWSNDDLTVAARPVRWHGRVAKVALVAVPYRDRSVLSPQFARAAFERIPQAHQVL